LRHAAGGVAEEDALDEAVDDHSAADHRMDAPAGAVDYSSS
jgi:hypothetical protein